MATRSEQLQIRLTPEQKASLRRKAKRAGQDLSSYVLSRVLPAGSERFSELVRAAADDTRRTYALAELNDLLSDLPGAQLEETTAGADLSGLSPLVRNYIAAMVEQAAHRSSVAAPAWVAEIEPLEEPHFAVPYASMRMYLLRAAPVAFKRRNLFVDASVDDRVEARTPGEPHGHGRAHPLG